MLSRDGKFKGTFTQLQQGQVCGSRIQHKPVGSCGFDELTYGVV